MKFGSITAGVTLCGRMKHTLPLTFTSAKTGFSTKINKLKGYLTQINKGMFLTNYSYYVLNQG